MPAAAPPSGLPWRGPGPGRPDLPLPPARARAWRGARPLKRWRYVGAYGPGLSLCVGQVRIGGAPQAFWATWDGAQLRERTRFLPRGVDVADGVARFPGADLRVEPAGEAVEVVSAHGASWIWTRKTPVRVRGRAGGREVDLPGLVDDSAGYHARVTSWRWSAGAGVAEDGRAVVWNLVAGVHDDPAAGEGTVWVDGVAHATGPAAFDADLGGLACDGARLAFAAEAERGRHDRLVLLDSAYRQPFGTFTGDLPGGVRLRTAHGVMEQHDVRW